MEKAIVGIYSVMYDFNYVVYIYFFILGQYIDNYRYMYNIIEVGSNAEDHNILDMRAILYTP